MASHGELSSHSTSDEDEDIKSEKVIQQNVCKRPGSAEPKINIWSLKVAWSFQVLAVHNIKGLTPFDNGTLTFSLLAPMPLFIWHSRAYA